jgi:hypothetical protein
MVTETAEQTALRFLTDFLNDDPTLARKWRSEADRRYNLTLQLCTSYADEIERLRAALKEIAGMTLQPAFKINRMTLVTAIKIAKTALETSGTGGDEQRSREGTNGAE